MTPPRKTMIAVYALIALAALVGTWSQNLFYFGAPSISANFAAFGTFVADLRVNAAARSISIDILAFLFATAIWMVHEARRVGVRHVWLYIAGAFLTAISVTFPLFMIAREYRLAARGEAIPLAGHDIVGLVVLGAVTVWLCAYPVA
jgi:hypothetical protein